MTTIQVGNSGRTAAEKELKTRYPVIEGLIAGTTKQKGRRSKLVATECSLVRQADREGLD